MRKWPSASKLRGKLLLPQISGEEKFKYSMGSGHTDMLLTVAGGQKSTGRGAGWIRKVHSGRLIGHDRFGQKEQHLYESRTGDKIIRHIFKDFLTSWWKTDWDGPEVDAGRPREWLLLETSPNFSVAHPDTHNVSSMDTPNQNRLHVELRLGPQAAESKMYLAAKFDILCLACLMPLGHSLPKYGSVSLGLVPATVCFRVVLFFPSCATQESGPETILWPLPGFTSP